MYRPNDPSSLTGAINQNVMNNTTDIQPESAPPVQCSDLLAAAERTQRAIVAIRKAFGPPGEYGYGSNQGKALCELYDSCNALADARAEHREVVGPGICDGCGATKPFLIVLNGAPAANVCMCPECLKPKAANDPDQRPGESPKTL